MTHSPLVNRKRYDSYTSYYGPSSYGGGGGSSYSRTHTEPISAQRSSQGISRHNTSVTLKPHHYSGSTLHSTADRKGPLRADHSIRVAGVGSLATGRKPLAGANSSFAPLNRQKSSSLSSLSGNSTTTGSSTQYRTLFDRITNDREERHFGHQSLRDGEALLRNAKMKLDKLNKDFWPANKPLSRKYSSMSDISNTTKGNSINTFKDEYRRTDNNSSKTLLKKQSNQQQPQPSRLNRTTSGVVHNRIRRSSIDNSSLSNKKNISSGLDDVTPPPTSPPTQQQQQQEKTSQHMSSSGASTSKESSDKQLQRYGSGIVGLRNLGNTCFMNSILQCLCKSSALRKYFFNKDYTKDINTQFKPTRGLLTKAFGEFIHEMWSTTTTSSVMTPSQLKREVEKFAPTFIGTHQHDSQEFLRFFVEGIHDELNAVKSKPTFNNNDDVRMSDDEKARLYWEQYLAREKSVIQGLFVGQLRSTLKCSICDHSSVTYDPFWDLSLPIALRKTGANVNIMNCFKAFTQEETLDGDEKPTCERCKKRRKCTKRFLIQKYPKILVLHLKRFSGHRFRTKLSTKVVFPLELNISEFVVASSETRDPPVYNLFGISNHMGGTGGGHYTAYCKHPDNSKWHLYNDTRVTESSTNDLVTSSAYVLFYSLNSSDG